MPSSTPHTKSFPRILVAIASYGTGNDVYLRRLIEEYRSMCFDVDIVILSNIEKNIDGSGIETLVGLPSKNPWSLPFSHKKLFVNRINDYDLFIYSEDDILITEKNVQGFLEVTPDLRENEVAGYFRFEMGSGGRMNYPDVHAHFHWNPTSVCKRGIYTLAKFTNEHAACYMLTQSQLMKAIDSGGFDVEPHEEKYDLLCTAATDPYTQCGFTKLIPISHIDKFIVHHMSNKYVDSMGVDAAELQRQIEALQQLEQAKKLSTPLVDSETKLWRNLYSKDYYESIKPTIISLIPESARSILSIGCGQGAMEIALKASGLSVTAVPLDTVICRGAAEAGVEIVEGNFPSARGRLEGRSFDCMLLVNLLHLAPDPVEVLSSFSELLSSGAPIIIQSPNMSNLPAIWRQIRDRRIETPWSYETSGVHFSSKGSIEKWCGKAGLIIEQTTEVLHRRAAAYDNLIPAVARSVLATDIIAVATRAA